MNNYILILISVMIASAGQLFLKKGAIINSSISEIFRNYFTWIGLFCFFAILWIVALSKMRYRPELCVKSLAIKLLRAYLLNN